MGFFEQSEDAFQKSYRDEAFLAKQGSERSALAAKFEREGKSQEQIDALWEAPYKQRPGSFYEEFLNDATRDALPPAGGFGNYVGPFWSDGKFQQSVAFGDAEVKSVLDYLARFHDTVYAEYKDRGHREASDIFFNDIAQMLQSNFAHVAGKTVLYGNYTARQLATVVSDLKSRLSKGDFIGAIGSVATAGFGNIKHANKMVNESYLRKEWEHLKELYHKDPKLNRLLEAGPIQRSEVVKPVGRSKEPLILDMEPQKKSKGVDPEASGVAKNMPRIVPEKTAVTHITLPTGKQLKRKVRRKANERVTEPKQIQPSFQQELEQIKKRLKTMGFVYKIEPKGQPVQPLQPKALLRNTKKNLAGLHIKTLFKK